MKTAVLAAALALMIIPANAAKREHSADEKLIMASLENLPARMKVEFDIPFPNDWDIDVHRKQPLGIMEVDGRKVCVTQPKMQPYDGQGSVEWMIGPEDPKQLTKTNVDCLLAFDDAGEIRALILRCDHDDWSSENSNSQIFRGDDETGPAYFERAMLTYRLRARKAKDPVFAARAISTAEKIATVVHQLRKEEAARKKE